MLRDRVTTVAELAGAASITAGCLLAWLPLGLVVGGVLLVVGGFLAGES